MSTALIEIAGLDGTTHVSTDEIAQLRSRLRGALLHPGDAGWSEAISIWNRMAAAEPALVIQPESTDDVSAAISFASRHGLRLSAKGGGHNIAGTCIARGGVVLDMSRMRSVSVDPQRRHASVDAGCRLGDVDRATQQHALATPLGFISDTGVAGLTLGGGLGYLTRRFGWTVDNLEEVEIVTADGVARTASREHEPELFWAVRGAGANFGVVTRFTYRLHPIGPDAFGGLIAWPFERASEVINAYRSLTRRAPRELAVWFIMLHAPPAPFVPSQWHGRRICGMAVCYTGNPATADDVLTPVRALGQPIFDLLGPRSYVDLQTYLDATEPSGVDHYWKTEYLASLEAGLADEMIATFADSTAPGTEIGLLHIGGALNEHGEDDGAVGNRDAHFALGIKAMWPPGSPHGDAALDWVRTGWRRLRPFSTGRTYINFQSADEEPDRIRATYGSNFPRLLAAKMTWDPDNLFRSNRNIAAQ